LFLISVVVRVVVFWLAESACLYSVMRLDRMYGCDIQWIERKLAVTGFARAGIGTAFTIDTTPASYKRTFPEVRCIMTMCGFILKHEQYENNQPGQVQQTPNQSNIPLDFTKHFTTQFLNW
jgi:hypothetical protein